jgi:D-lyxose ketol-isomerase
LLDDKEHDSMKRKDVVKAQKRAASFLEKANIELTEMEMDNIEVADFGLNDIERVGLQLVTYENNDRYCAKELVLFPRQMCPEHRHPPLSEQNIGKQETFRCRWGEVYLYVEGEPAPRPRARVLPKYRRYLSVWHEIVMRPGDQHTIKSNTLHWFQAGSKGAIVSEFSSASVDETDVWTDPNIKRIPVVD